MIAGIERLDHGRIAIGISRFLAVSFMPPKPRGVGLMFQDFALFTEFVGARQCRLGRKRWAARSARQEPLPRSARMDLPTMRPIIRICCPWGQQQRVALAGRSCRARPVMLMDERFPGSTAACARVPQ